MLAASRKRGRSTSRRRGSMARRFARNPAYISRSRSRVRGRRGIARVQGAHTFSRRCAVITEEMNGLFLARMYEISFSDLISATEFSNLFDQYRITKVTYSIQMTTNPNSIQVTNASGNGINDTRIQNTNWYPKVWYVVDHDGGTTETISTIKERQGVRCRILQPNREIRVSFRPKCRTLTYSTSSATGYAPKNIKIDMTDTNVEHYGLQVVFDSNGLDPSDTYPFRFTVERKVYFTCYGVR